MTRFAPYRRSNELDQPKPETVEHEWIVMDTDGRRWALPAYVTWPDTDAGQIACSVVAHALNKAYERGADDARQAVREALGL